MKEERIAVIITGAIISHLCCGYFFPGWYILLARNPVFWLDHVIVVAMITFLRNEKGQLQSGACAFVGCMLFVGNMREIRTWQAAAPAPARSNIAPRKAAAVPAKAFFQRSRSSAKQKVILPPSPPPGVDSTQIKEGGAQKPEPAQKEAQVPSPEGVYRVGNGVTPPIVISKVEADYTELARRARYQGTVTIYLEVDQEGRPRNLRVLKSLGLGLDEKALEAVAKWRFRPGFKDGHPVPIQATIEVNFRLL